MKYLLLLSALALSAQVATAQSATVKTKTKGAGQPSAKTKTSGVVALAEPAAAAGPASAADDSRTTARANALTENMRTALNLTPAQTEKVREINTTSVRNVEQGRLRYRTEPAKLKAYVEGVSVTRLQAIKDVLSPAQFDKYQRKREEKMGLPSAPAATGNAAPGLRADD